MTTLEMDVSEYATDGLRWTKGYQKTRVSLKTPAET